MSATALSGQQLAALREQAAARSTSFVDPAQLRRVQEFTSGRPEWASAIIGRPFSLRAMTGRELVLLDLAAQAEPTPPAPPRAAKVWEAGYEPTEAERAAAERRAARFGEWAALRELLPVPVRVVHNYTSRRHTENHVQGVEHILVTTGLHVGRLHRAAGRALCFTPAKARDHRHMSLDSWEPRDDERLPTCVACIRTAYRLTDRDPSGGLL